MKKYLFLVGLTFGAYSCGQSDSNSKISVQTSPAPRPRIIEELGASDLSILVPLQSSTFEDPSESVFFGKVGTGMCNAPTLDLGGADPILSQSLWQDWAKDSLMSVLPLPSNALAYRADVVTAGLSSTIASLKADMNALPDVDLASDDLCPEAIGSESLQVDNVELLRNEGTNVAVTQSLPAGACHYKNWRVVAARFEPCSYRPSVLAHDPGALTESTNPRFPSEACGGAELRLVLQPFIANEDGGFTSIDMAIHAFYKIDDTNAFIDDLRNLRSITRTVLKGQTGEGTRAVWYADEKDMLLPHPGLREEMDCKDGLDSPQRVGVEWRRILAKYARQSQLFKLTWMASDNSGSNWSFGLRLVQPKEGTVEPRFVKRGESFKVETFTLSQITRGFPFTPFDLRLKSLDYFYKAGRTDKLLTSDEGKSALKELIDIANPDKTSLNLGGKNGASCASCHTRDQTEKAVRTRTGKTHDQLAALAETDTRVFAIWDPIRKNIEKRNDNNLRNFGYGPAMTMGVSQRALNEIDAVRQVVNSYFAKTQDLSLPASFISKVNSPVSFEGDIKPLLEARCGYCHSSKRAPLLLNERIAEVYSSAIVTNICSANLAFQHMPPGKTLPREEKSLVLAWADSLDSEAEPLSCEGLAPQAAPNPTSQSR
ncbi:MAG: hypothetical protein H7318_09770 [Oligoflexus sp.]|nr:hypothetical protein [Oligoflexus sp.]